MWTGKPFTESFFSIYEFQPRHQPCSTFVARTQLKSGSSMSIHHVLKPNVRPPREIRLVAQSANGQSTWPYASGEMKLKTKCTTKQGVFYLETRDRSVLPWFSSDEDFLRVRRSAAFTWNTAVKSTNKRNSGVV